MTQPTTDPTPCDSCGRDEGDLVEVRRVYLDAEVVKDLYANPDETPAEVVDEIERWCASCVATYPHVRD
ncbi:MAG TPA: hypothetical protein VJM33_18825 [Microthrixaceae bacterium]|nr:hypothetical protein [Microthrixaceae bacterium]